jgi:hypothetical protein
MTTVEQATRPRRRLTPVVVWLCWVISSGALVVWSCGLLSPHDEAPPPDLVGRLERAKWLSEGMAQEVKRPGRLPPEDLDEGERLYAAARAEFDTCIDFLRGGLAGRLRGVDPTTIEKRLREADGRMTAFLDWGDRAQGEGTFSAVLDPFAPLLRGVSTLIDQAQKADGETLKAMRQGLENCRLQAWEDIQPATPAKNWEPD